MERSNRTIREGLDEVELETDPFAGRYEAEDALRKIVEWYNGRRLHSSLGFLRPADYYRGEPSVLHEERRRKLTTARHRRREKNLQLQQPTLPLEPGPTSL